MEDYVKSKMHLGDEESEYLEKVCKSKSFDLDFINLDSESPIEPIEADLFKKQKTLGPMKGLMIPNLLKKLILFNVAGANQTDLDNDPFTEF